ncbi:hypothetical protein [Chryseobacterium indoltheticum]|uniref:hypothetical protein n=1 Tax=Chryseobacterium indoltheticum TaxID=254 RepID=UPI003F496C61
MRSVGGCLAQVERSKNRSFRIYRETLSRFSCAASVKVSVTDYGMGISQQDHSKIFERFFRARDIQKKIPRNGNRSLHMS